MGLRAGGLQSTNKEPLSLDRKGKLGYTDAALTYYNNQEKQNFPGERAPSPKTDPRAQGGGLGDLAAGAAKAGAVAGAGQQILGLLEKLISSKQATTPQPAATTPGVMTMPSTQLPTTNTPSDQIIITENTGCGDFCKNMTLSPGQMQCQQVSGGLTTVTAAGSPGCTVSNDLLANPSTKVSNPKDNAKNVVAPIVTTTDASSTPSLRVDLTLPAGSQGTVDASQSINSGITAAAVMPIRRLTVDMSDDVVVFDHASFTNTRVPYDSAANDRPLYHHVTGELLPNAGELYPIYTRRPERLDREVSTRLSFYKGDSPQSRQEEVSFGWVAKSIAKVSARKDARVDMWAQTSFISTVIQAGLFRGLSTMVDGHNLQAVNIYDYLLDNGGSYSYFVSDGEVMIQRSGKVIESSKGLPPPTDFQMRVVQRL